MLDLMKAHTAGQLSDHSFNVMNGLVKELQQSPLKGDIWKSTTQAVRDRLIRTDLLEGRDAVGSANYASFMQHFVPAYLAKSRADALQPNALDLNDPKSMISQMLQPYKTSMQRGLTTMAQQPAAPPAPPVEKPPMPGARKALDGNWYVPDPKRPGKYLRVDQ
jgi:hypothetical protein